MLAELRPGAHCGDEDQVCEYFNIPPPPFPPFSPPLSPNPLVAIASNHRPNTQMCLCVPAELQPGAYRGDEDQGGHRAQRGARDAVGQDEGQHGGPGGEEHQGAGRAKGQGEEKEVRIFQLKIHTRLPLPPPFPPRAPQTHEFGRAEGQGQKAEIADD